MTTAPPDAGREAGGWPLGARHAQRFRRAAAAAPGWYAAAVLALGVFAAVALVGVPPGAGLAALGVALCAVAAAATGAARGRGSRADAAYRAALWLFAAGLAAMPAVRAAGWVWIWCLVGAAMLASLAATGGRSGGR